MVVVSHEHRFVFVKCIRVASSSMEEFFWRFRGKEDVFTPFPPRWDKRQNDKGYFNFLKDLPYVFKLFEEFPKYGVYSVGYRVGWITRVFRHFKRSEAYYDHMPAWMVRNRIGKKVFDKYFIFCFERNPWDKVVSRYLFYKKFDRNFNLSFREFVKSDWIYDALNFPLYINPLSGKIMVDFIGYYENLEEDFAKAMRKIGLPEELDVNINTSRETEIGYRRFYDRELRIRVEDVYRYEIELHGYDF